MRRKGYSVRVFLHGLGQGPSAWDKTIAAMGSAEGCDCPDLFLLAQDKKADYFGICRAFSAYCEKYDEPIDLCGLSLGGMVALWYAAEHSKKVRRLALIGARCSMPKGLMKLQAAVFRLMPRSAFLKLGLTKKDAVGLMRSMTDVDLKEETGKVACPALIVCGEKDGANKGAAADLKRRLPRAEYAILPGAGHEANLDAPDELGLMLKRFFETDEPERAQ